MLGSNSFTNAALPIIEIVTDRVVTMIVISVPTLQQQQQQQHHRRCQWLDHYHHYYYDHAFFVEMLCTSGEK